MSRDLRYVLQYDPLPFTNRYNTELNTIIAFLQSMDDRFSCELIKCVKVIECDVPIRISSRRKWFDTEIHVKATCGDEVFEKFKELNRRPGLYAFCATNDEKKMITLRSEADFNILIAIHFREGDVPC